MCVHTYYGALGGLDQVPFHLIESLVHLTSFLLTLGELQHLLRGMVPPPVISQGWLYILAFSLYGCTLSTLLIAVGN